MTRTGNLQRDVLRFPRRAAILLVALVLLGGCRTRQPLEPALDLTGSWTLTVEGVCQGLIEIVQTENTLGVTGSIGGGLCPFSASGFGDGLLNGRDISFGIGFGSGSDAAGSGLGSVTFQGSVEPNGNRMGGRYEGNRSGTWEATRR